VSDFDIIRAADRKVMRWKNGGGETAEIAVSPPGAALDDFDWRLSMAKVEADGPFSAFPGIDRTLVILEGEGIRLSIAGQPAVKLTNASQPHGFPADADASAALIEGAILDLNVMSRRGSFSHAVERVRVDGVTDAQFRGSQAIAFCDSGAITLIAGEASMELKGYDTLIWRGGDSVVSLKGTGLLYLIYLLAKPSPCAT
jgi:uncharacterized protein